MSTSTLAGVLPVVQCPFTADGAVALDQLRSESEWVLAQGVSGLTTGMVTEVLRLTETERNQVNEVVAGVAADAGLVSVVSAGAESTRTAVAYARSAKAAGATAVMVIPPLSVALGEDALFGYYVDIAEQADIDVVVQDASGYVGRPLSVDVQSRLLARLEDRVYFKPEADPIGQRLSELRDATGGQARIFEGTGGAALIDSFRRGIVGTMPGAEVCWALQRLWDALVADDFDLAYTISGPLLGLINLQTSIDSFVAVEKHLLKAQGVFDATHSRGPLNFVLDDETAAEVDRLHRRLQIAVGRD